MDVGGLDTNVEVHVGVQYMVVVAGYINNMLEPITVPDLLSNT